MAYTVKVKRRKDEAHDWTDDEIEKLEKQIRKEYARAEKELTKKLDHYMNTFAKNEKIMKQRLRKKEITQAEYDTWMYNHIMMGKRWEQVRNTIAEDLTHTNQIAISTAKGHMASAYAMNTNFASYQIEHDAGVDLSWSLYSQESVERLWREKPKLLPDPQVDIPKDLRWNKQKLTSELTQGILQGESIDKLARRLSTVVAMDRVAALRNARTMMTGAQNAGRRDAYRRAEKMGIKGHMQWISTLDEYTRLSHRKLYGEFINEKTGRFSNGCRYPGDHEGRPEEVYNCRCTMLYQLEGHEIELPRSPANGQTFEEWQAGKKKAGQVVTTTQSPTQTPAKTEPAKPKEPEKPAWSPTQYSGKKITQMLLPMNSNDRKIFENILNEAKKTYGGSVAQVWKRIASGEINDPGINAKLAQLLDPETIAKQNKPLEWLKGTAIKAFKTEKYKGKRYVSDIVKELAGGDLTSGSCASLAIGYCGQLAGYDVHDFRDGESRDWFSTKSNTRAMFRSWGISVIESKYTGQLSGAKQLMKDMDPNREYLLSAGRHMAAVRKNASGVYEYLELQSSKESMNGWHAFADYGLDLEQGLKWRWAANSSQSFSVKPALIPVDEIVASEQFPAILDYINTPIKDQKKGTKGRMR